MDRLPSLLLVDDDVLLRRTLARAIEGSFETTEASDGAEAIEILAHRSFDVIVTDLEMPRMAGDELFAWLEQHQPAMTRRVVVVSGGSPRAKRAAWLNAFDRDRVLAKPFTIAALLAVLERLGPFRSR